MRFGKGEGRCMNRRCFEVETTNLVSGSVREASSSRSVVGDDYAGAKSTRGMDGPLEFLEDRYSGWLFFEAWMPATGGLGMAIYVTSQHTQETITTDFTSHLAPHSRSLPPPAAQAIMGATMSVVKTLIAPALVSLLIFIIITYVLLPIWRRYRSRYSQYLPLDSLSTQTASWRQRITARLVSLLPLPGSSDRNAVFSGGSILSDDDDSDDGEELGDVHDESWRVIRRSNDAVHPDAQRRLSRELVTSQQLELVGVAVLTPN
ncbi:hypothetical protein G7046_g8012 [Stylonectria norvegica]|nr:hypothetical protein G7046_g8012 [Stylonectria norvegica]